MENPTSPLETLRQLKEMLDAGALTPTEFEALKQRLVFAPAAPEPVAPEPVPAPEAPVADPAPGPQPDVAQPDLPVALPVPAGVEVEALVFEPVPEPLFMPEASADFPVAVGGPGYVGAEALTDDAATFAPNPPAGPNSSLGLVLAIGAVLVFLAVVGYLGFTRPASEHISSTSQTAADSVATTIETGPQVAPLPATTAVPETVRVAPTNPAPPSPSRPQMEQKAAAIRDSAAPAAPPAAPDSVLRR